MEPVKRISFAQKINPLTFHRSPQPVFTHATSLFHRSPQPSYPSRHRLSNDDWYTVSENRAIVDVDPRENTDPTPPNNHDVPKEQEWSGMIAELMSSPEHISEHAGSSYQKTKEDGSGALEGVGSKDEIDWGAVMSFYTSMQKKQPCGGIFFDSAASWESRLMENEEINPKKKQPRLEQAGEGEGFCKRCKCQKSKCLMLYCGCFAAGVYCMGPCACINCLNKPIHKDNVLAARKQIELRNPLAFAPKVIRYWGSLPEIGDDFKTTPRHRRGCSCKKGCQMKYCGCYQGSVGCSFYCRCEGCKNSFGTKENGLGVLGMDHELEEGETNMNKSAELNRSFQKTTIPDNLGHTVDSALTATASGTRWNFPSVEATPQFPLYTTPFHHLSQIHF